MQELDRLEAAAEKGRLAYRHRPPLTVAGCAGRIAAGAGANAKGAGGTARDRATDRDGVAADVTDRGDGEEVTGRGSFRAFAV